MKLAIFGFGGHSKEVAVQINHPVTFFVDDEYIEEGVNPISSFNPEIYKIIVAVSDSQQRKKIVEKLPEDTKFFTFVHPTAILMSKDITIGEGSFIGANSILTTNIQIGKHAILNRGNQIGHDTIIGNFFSAMPGAIVSGNVSIGDRVYFGTNSTVIEKKKISNDVIIGANGVVVNNLIEPGTYVGVPVKKIK
jgi:sugar O-acyltransferase (sialic acid O-acetyltransferase NeuD family)